MKATLAERAAIGRRMAREHRSIAAETLRIADRLDEEARLMEQGIDPFKKEVTK